MGDAGFNGEREALAVHIGDHENIAAHSLRGDADDEPIRIKLRRKARALFKLVFDAARGEGNGHGAEPLAGVLL